MAKKHKYDYFDAYEELSDLAVQEASVLVRAMENFTDAAALRAVLDEAHALEHAGDMINHDIYKHVGNDFMPPFDREDIVALAGAGIGAAVFYRRRSEAEETGGDDQ